MHPALSSSVLQPVVRDRKRRRATHPPTYSAQHPNQPSSSGTAEPPTCVLSLSTFLFSRLQDHYHVSWDLASHMAASTPRSRTGVPFLLFAFPLHAIPATTYYYCSLLRPHLRNTNTNTSTNTRRRLFHPPPTASRSQCSHAPRHPCVLHPH